MPRKNSRVSRSNQRGRYAERHIGVAPMKQQPRVQLEKLIMPDGQCTFQTPRRPKARFADKDKAEAALRQAQQQRARTGSTHVEKRVYRCPEGGCGGWHLSSREAFDERIWRQRRDLYEQGNPGGQP